MLLDQKTRAVPAPPVRPGDHLTNAKYKDVIERDSGAVGKIARWCVWSDVALDKCRGLSRAAFTREVRPKFECTRGKDQASCLKTLQEGKADLVVLEGGEVLQAIRDVNAQPLAAESYGPGSTKDSERPAVAVVKKSSSIKKLGERTLQHPSLQRPHWLTACLRSS